MQSKIGKKEMQSKINKQTRQKKAVYDWKKFNTKKNSTHYSSTQEMYGFQSVSITL